MYRSFIACLLAGSIGLIDVTQAVGQQNCKPALTIKEVKFSGMQPPTGERRWTAVVSVDASRCTTTAGFFEIGFSRQKENGGRRSRRALLDRQRSSVPLRQMTEVRPQTTNLHAVLTVIRSITCDPRATFDRSNSSPIPAYGTAAAEDGAMS